MELEQRREPRKRRKLDEFVEFRHWLTTLEMANPSLHVNGTAHPSAALTVDFGTPLTEQKLTVEQSAELVTRLRTMTKAMFYDREVNVQVQSDTMNGIWWAGIG